MSLTIITRAFGSFAAPRRLGAALVATTAVLFATAGPAAAYTPNPIPLNTPTWSGNACCGASAPGWYEDAFGIIHLQGAVTQTASGGSPLIATLPPAARPNREVYTIVHTFGGTYADLANAPDGRIGVITPRPPAVRDFSFVSLEGISYRPANNIPTTPIEINETNWTDTFTTANPGFGATPAAWYKDGSGIVHLHAVDQFNAQPGGASQPTLIGAVPPAAAPARDLVTVVHTFLGTYATLEINTSGQLFAFGPPPSAVTDLSFVSLEGVSYEPGALFTHIGNVNTINWRDCGGSQDLGWVEDSTAVIHLQGCARQFSPNGPNPNLIATLPAFIAPTRTVYTIALAGLGYADLAIAPDGGIRAIGPTAPPNLAFLSLEEITFQPSSTAGPHGFSLTRNGDVLALLRKARKLELIVFKRGPRAHLVGTVKVGSASAGRSRFHWGVRVAGHRLRAGTYTAELAAVPRHGLASGGPGVMFKLAYPTGPIRVLSSTCSVADAAKNRC